MSDELDKVRQHVLRYGWNSTCFQVVNPGIRHWWSKDGLGLVGFVISGRLAVVAGAPICPEELLPSVLEEWSEFCRKSGWKSGYFGAEERLQNALKGSANHCQVVLGCQPEWSPLDLVKRFSTIPSLRAQINRARNKGLKVSEWDAEKAKSDPRLKGVLAAWLETRGLPTMRFLVEPDTLDNLEGRRIFVAEQGENVVAFLNLCPSPCRKGWLTEEFPRLPDAPNGTVESLLAIAARTVSDEDSQFFTMGIIPLLTSEEPKDEPRWLRPIRKWAQAHHTRFYNFRGLFEFKSKFRPTKWTPVLVIIEDRRFRLSHLRALVKAFTVIAPELAMVIGLGRAARTEIGWLLRRSRKKR